MSRVRGFSAMSGRMRWADGFIAVDWGTTNRRAWLVGGNGECLSEMSDDRGILSVPAGGYPEEIALLRSELGERPMLLVGMIGSNRGWIEASYVACPAGLDAIVSQLIWAEAGRTAIVPGVSYLAAERVDVMRGEEVQVLGAAARGLVPNNGLVCHPGTHNKWVTLAEGKIAEFRTVMTGELFDLLRKHSVLSDSLDDRVNDGEPFRAGVRLGLRTNSLTSDLFGIRATALLQPGRQPNPAAFASGLLIGADLQAGLGPSGDSLRQISVMGSPQLTRLYRAALEEAGWEAREIPGDASFIAGAILIAERI